MKAKTINISLPVQVLKQIDRQADEEYKSRSELLREAVLLYIQTKDNWSVLQNEIAVRAKIMGLTSEDDIEKMVDTLRP